MRAAVVFAIVALCAFGAHADITQLSIGDATLYVDLSKLASGDPNAVSTCSSYLLDTTFQGNAVQCLEEFAAAAGAATECPPSCASALSAPKICINTLALVATKVVIGDTTITQEQLVELLTEASALCQTAAPAPAPGPARRLLM